MHLTLVDFDRTLFDTAGFVKSLLRVLQQELGIKPDEFREEIAARSIDEAYDLFRHLDELGFASTEPMLRRRLSEQNFLFSDAKRFVQEAPQLGAVVLVTVGNERYQRFKLGLCPPLAHLRQIILPANKGDWLAVKWHDRINIDGSYYDTATLIDDAPDTFKNPPVSPRLKLIQLVRPGARYPATTRSDVQIADDLDSVLLSEGRWR